MPNKQKLSKSLTSEEIKLYKEMGEVNESQNWLELFQDEIIQDLITIKDSCSDNDRKAEYIKDMLATHGFEERGTGTNILTLSNPVYPGVVFKIALDDCGMADNYNDTILQTVIPEYTPVFAMHPSLMVSVQRRDVVIRSRERMMEFKPKILKMLERLATTFLLIDISPVRFLNYGVGRDGKFTLIDGSDLYPLELIEDKIRCIKPVRMDKHNDKMKRCGGRLRYTSDFNKLVCEKCAREYNPIDFRPEKGVSIMANIMRDSFNEELRASMISDEIEMIRSRTTPAYPHKSDTDGRKATVTNLDVSDDTFKLVHKNIFKNMEPECDSTHTSDEDDQDDVKEALQSCNDTKREFIFVGAGDKEDDSVYLINANESRDEDEYDTDEDDEETLQDVVEKLRRVDTESLEESDASYLTYNIDPDNGIYINIVGDFNEAWDECGLPVFISKDNGQTYTKAIATSVIKQLLDMVISDLSEEEAQPLNRETFQQPGFTQDADLIVSDHTEDYPE